MGYHPVCAPLQNGGKLALQYSSMSRPLKTADSVDRRLPSPRDAKSKPLIVVAVTLAAPLAMAICVWVADSNSEAPQGMAWIPGGEFSMGSEDPRASLCG